jgi:hypothetical protein
MHVQHNAGLEKPESVVQGTSLTDQYMPEILQTINSIEEKSVLVDLAAAFTNNSEEKSVLAAEFKCKNEILHYLMSACGPFPTCPDVGKKENVSFALCNRLNRRKFSEGKHMKYVSDDKGACTRPVVRTIVYVLSEDRLVSCPKWCLDAKTHLIKDLDGNVIIAEKVKNLFVLRTASRTLKKNKDYKIKQSFFLKTPKEYEHLLDNCLLEYCGEDMDSAGSSETPHGNAKHKMDPYYKQNPIVIEKIKDLLRANVTPKNVYKETINVRNPLEGARDISSINNIKKNLVLDGIEESFGKNVVDDVVKMLNELIRGNSEYVRKAWLDKSGRPCLAMYYDWQIEDIRNNCTTRSQNPSVLGIDRTFNIGPCYLTITCYQNPNLKRQKTGTNPIIPGPMYLHWDGKYQTYADFLHHLSGLLEDPCVGVELSGKLLFGSDEEHALTKAAEKAFPNATFMLCARHLEENTSRHLKDQGSADAKTKKKLVDSIYGPSGLTSSLSKVEFLEKKLLIDSSHFGDRYFENLMDKLWGKVVLPRLCNVLPINIDDMDSFNSLSKFALPVNWKNNNCESFNNSVKTDELRKVNIF